MKPPPRSSSAAARTPPRTARIPPPGSLASSITFFVSAADRAAILARLRPIHPDRAAALLIALKLDRPGDTP